MSHKLAVLLQATGIFVIEIILSVCSTVLFVKGVTPQNYTVCVLLAIMCFLVHVILYVLAVRRSIFGGVKFSDCAPTHLAVFLFFAVVTLCVSALNIEPLYTYLFLEYKVFAFSLLPRFISALIINGILLLVYILVPWLCSTQYELEKIRSYLNDIGKNSGFEDSNPE